MSGEQFAGPKQKGKATDREIVYHGQLCLASRPK